MSSHEFWRKCDTIKNNKRRQLYIIDVIYLRKENIWQPEKMVQKYQSPVRVYKYPFELVMRAYEMRFPTCDMIPIVRETEILEEVVDDVTGIHLIDRRAKVRNGRK